MKRNKFSLSHYRLLTADMGLLIPLTWYEGLPSDTIRQSSQLLVRASPLVAPMMHPVRIRIHHWFVPYRIIWEDFTDFITGGEDGKFAASPPNIQFDSTVDEGSLADYLGIPTGDYTGNTLAASALPFRAYAKIFNEFYRDEQLVTALAENVASGEDLTTPQVLQRVAWEKDFFTTIRPSQSLGDQITLPIGTSAPIATPGVESANVAVKGPSGESFPLYDATPSSANNIKLGASGAYESEEIFADLSAATGITVNELREYLALQRYQENRNKWGARFHEYLRYAFGVNPQDARLQEPEYLGGGREQLQISEVLQSQRTDTGESPLGSMAGHGISAMRTNRYQRFIPEHGLIMTLMSVVPKAMYMQAVPRKWHRLNKEAYFQRELQFLGDTEVTNREVYSEHSSPAGTFGYNPIYDEYRYEPSGVSGEFRSTLNHWHLAREFASDPALNADFINCNPTKRVFADNVSHSLWIMANHSIQARRAIAKWPKAKTF